MQQHGPLVRFFHFCLSKDFNQRLKARSPRNRPQLSAGPPSITGDPEIDADGGMTALRQGTNDFNCMLGDPTGIGMRAMCANRVAHPK
jgi:hypothetical protein